MPLYRECCCQHTNRRKRRAYLFVTENKGIFRVVAMADRVPSARKRLDLSRVQIGRKYLELVPLEKSYFKMKRKLIFFYL